MPCFILGVVVFIITNYGDKAAKKQSTMEAIRIARATKSIKTTHKPASDGMLFEDQFCERREGGRDRENHIEISKFDVRDFKP